MITTKFKGSFDDNFKQIEKELQADLEAKNALKECNIRFATGKILNEYQGLKFKKKMSSVKVFMKT